MLSLIVLSCSKNPPEDVIETPPTTIDTSYKIKYLALGDSYTIGQGVSPAYSYPIQLTDRLIADSIGVDTTIIIARTGWRTDALIDAINQENLTDTFDLVSLLIGVNNQYQGIPISVYETEFPELLQMAIDLAGGDKNRVFVLSIPDYGYTPFGEANQTTISAEIDLYNNINGAVTQAEGISWFDITPISRNGLSDPDLVALDDLHPSGKMYSQWVDLMYAEVRDKLME